MQLIDTHFHLDYYQNHAYWYGKINELKQYTLCVTNSPGIFHSCRRLYCNTKYIKFALGYNPQQSVKEPFSRELFLHELPNTDYIGEVGLDFSKSYIDTEASQIDSFTFICNVAGKHRKLLSVHSRKAEKETLRILAQSHISRAIIHWYTGDIETLRAFLDLGYYFSVNASMCVTPHGREIITHIPTNRLLIESDGPFSKISGKKYTPTKLEDVYSAVESVTGNPHLRNVIWSNFKELLLK